MLTTKANYSTFKPIISLTTKRCNLTNFNPLLLLTNCNAFISLLLLLVFKLYHYAKRYKRWLVANSYA